MGALAFTEQQFIAWVTDGPACPLPLGPGDDAAQLHDGTVVALDTVVEGVHFEAGTDLDQVARKALGACLSDLCAMGAVAEAVFISAQLPPGTDGRTLAASLRSWADRFAVVLAGGDTVSTTPGALALAVTACGRCPAGTSPWLRSGARVGDRLVVTGPLGGSRTGRHLLVLPRADVVAFLRRRSVPVHAALDISDGLLADLPRICAASGVGARVLAAAVPIHADALGMADPLAHALGDGEDFELLLCLPQEADLPPGSTVIGEICDGPLVLVDSLGHAGPWPAGGHQHAF